MVAMPMDEQEMELIGNVFCLPMTLIINFSLFQYLATFYYQRRAEPRGMLLIFCAFGGFAALVPYAHPNLVMVGHLNDVSETFSVLTFLLQIVIVGRDVNRKVRIRTLKFVSISGECLAFLGLLVVLLNLLEVMVPGIDVSAFDGVDNIFENVTLWFIFFARFFYIVLSRGLVETIKTRKLDIFFYLLFVTHEYPFLLLEYLTGVSWEAPQALWNRLTILFCIVLTIREKLRSASSKQSKVNHTNMKHTTQGPHDKSIYVSDSDPAGPSLTKTTRLGTAVSTAKSFRSILVGASSVRPHSGRK
jgi:hypothetical protein